MARRTGPLSRFTVIDLWRVRSGPTAVRQLADWGADVIIVEHPVRGDGQRGLASSGVSTEINDDHEVWCDPFICYEVEDNNYVNQFEVSAGLVIRFGN